MHLIISRTFQLVKPKLDAEQLQELQECFKLMDEVCADDITNGSSSTCVCAPGGHTWGHTYQGDTHAGHTGRTGRAIIYFIYQYRILCIFHVHETM